MKMNKTETLCRQILRQITGLKKDVKINRVFLLLVLGDSHPKMETSRDCRQTHPSWKKSHLKDNGSFR